MKDVLGLHSVADSLVGIRRQVPLARGKTSLFRTKLPQPILNGKLLEELRAI